MNVMHHMIAVSRQKINCSLIASFWIGAVLISSVSTLSGDNATSNDQETRRSDYGETNTEATLKSSPARVLYLKRSRALPWLGVGEPPVHYRVPSPPILHPWVFEPAEGHTVSLWPQIIAALKLSEHPTDKYRKRQEEISSSHSRKLVALRRSDGLQTDLTNTSSTDNSTTNTDNSISTKSPRSTGWLTLDSTPTPTKPKLSSYISKQDAWQGQDKYQRVGRALNVHDKINTGRKNTRLDALKSRHYPIFSRIIRQKSRSRAAPHLAARQGKINDNESILNNYKSQNNRKSGNQKQGLADQRLRTNAISSVTQKYSPIKRRWNNQKWMTRVKKTQNNARSMIQRLFGEMAAVKNRIKNVSSVKDRYSNRHMNFHQQSFYQHPSSGLTAPAPSPADTLAMHRSKYHLPKHINQPTANRLGTTERFLPNEAVRQQQRAVDKIQNTNNLIGTPDTHQYSKYSSKDLYDFFPVYSTYKTYNDKNSGKSTRLSYRSSSNDSQFETRDRTAKYGHKNKMIYENQQQQRLLSLMPTKRNFNSSQLIESVSNLTTIGNDLQVSERKEDGTLVVTATLLKETPGKTQSKSGDSLDIPWIPVTIEDRVTHQQAVELKEQESVIVDAQNKPIKRRHLNTEADTTSTGNIYLPWQPFQHAAIKLHQLIEAKYSR